MRGRQTGTNGPGAIAFVVWMLLGGFVTTALAADITAPDASSLALASDGRDGRDPTEVRGVVTPVDQVTISAEFSARLDKVPFDEGQRFKKGQLLIRFDCAHYRAQTRAAWAAYRVHEKSHAANVELDRFQAVGTNEVEKSAAEMKRAAAQAKSLEAKMRQCKIVAPFSGVVVERLVQRHEVPRSNEPLLRIMNDSALELDLIVPSRWLRWLRRGEAFDFYVEETDSTHTAKVKRIAAAVDPVSQTVKISGVFEKRPKRVLPGMSGSAHFQPH
ncbi:MAG: efflux RND transporter periplasmic adaptor subunit [Pseudomonadota bacterium]